MLQKYVRPNQRAAALSADVQDGDRVARNGSALPRLLRLELQAQAI